MDLNSSDNDGKKYEFSNNNEHFTFQFIWFFCIDSNMELMDQSSNEDAVFNNDNARSAETDDIDAEPDADAEIEEFDTDLPAAHNVWTSFDQNEFTMDHDIFPLFFSIWVNWNVYQVCNIWSQAKPTDFQLVNFCNCNNTSYRFRLNSSHIPFY